MITINIIINIIFYYHEQLTLLLLSLLSLL